MVPGGREKVVSFCRLADQLVQEPGGCSSLPVEAGEREKVVAFCRWVPTYWYESAPAQCCKHIFLLLKGYIDDNNRWFSPTLGLLHFLISY